MLETILLSETDMAASSVAVSLPWDGLFNELRTLAEARRSSRERSEPLALTRKSEPAQPQDVTSLPLILEEAAAAISAAQLQAERLEQHVAAVVESSNARVQAA